jgi:hypothetical protein
MASKSPKITFLRVFSVSQVLPSAILALKIVSSIE